MYNTFNRAVQLENILITFSLQKYSLFEISFAFYLRVNACLIHQNVYLQ